MGAPNTRGYVKNTSDFQQVTHCILKMVQDRRIVSMKGEQEAICILSNDDTADNVEI